MGLSSENNKRIAQNTIMLYIRMLVVMGVTFYTSRIILQVLGVEDFGIYNIVGGIVILFSFLNATMTSASQRYLSVAIGLGNNEHTKKVFTSCLVLHLFLALAVLFLSETVGVWLLLDILDIPSQRQTAALWVYQFAVLTTFLNVIKIPYNALIIANERMNFYAYTSILESLLKLGIVFILSSISFDKLISYSVLLLIINCIIVVWFWLYCKKNFAECAITRIQNSKLMREIASFSGWNLFGSIGDICYKQGTNIIMNVFHGVTLNATIGITNQLHSAVFLFISNLQTAAIPQIIKTYATKDYARYKMLVCQISKYSFFLMLVLSLPIIINIDLILQLWLVNPPLYSNIFVVLIMVFSLIDSLQGPLWASMQAMGNIRMYQIAICICLLLNLPISYIFLYLKFHPAIIYIVQSTIALFTLIVRIYFSHNFANVEATVYAKQTLMPILAVSIVSIPIIFYVSILFDGWLKLFISSFLSLLIIPCSVLFVGISKNERRLLICLVKQKINH